MYSFLCRQNIKTLKKGKIMKTKKLVAKIVVTVNSGGLVDGVYTNSVFRDADVEIIDFCTDDPEEKHKAEKAWKNMKSQRLVQLY